VAVVAILAGLAFFPTDSGYVAFYTLFVATFPVSLPATYITYVGFLFFGPDEDGLVARSLVFVLWVVLATAQMVAIRALIRSIRRNRAASRTCAVEGS